MTYTPDMNSMSRGGGAYMIDQKEIERVLKKLVARQTGGLSAYSSNAVLLGETTNSWQAGQLDFAKRLAQISMKQAVAQKAKITWKHRSVGILRRLSLLAMVATILAVQYI